MSELGTRSDDPATGPFSVTAIRNNDLVGAIERIDIAVAELAKSESADSGGSQIYDRQRIDQYNRVIDQYMDYVVAQTGKVDVPYTYPTYYDIEYISNTLNVDITNKAMRDLLRLYLQMMEQLSKCDSAGWSNGIQEFDYGRYVLLRDKIQSFLDNYVDQTNPIDMPEYNAYRDGTAQNPQSVQVAGPLAVQPKAPQA